MKLRNLGSWKLDANLGALLFFAQRMDELLFEYSLDSYKPPALNAPYLCIEAIDLISEIEKKSMDEQNLEPVLEELRWSIQGDVVARSLLDLDATYYTLSNEETPLAQTRLRLEVLGRTLNPRRYLNATKVALVAAVRENKKSEVDYLATSFLTTVINMGVSRYSIFSQLHDRFFDPNGAAVDSVEVCEEFLEGIIPISHGYEGYVLVSSLIKEVSESIDAFGMEIVDALPEGVEAPWGAGGEDGLNVLVKVSEINSSDYHSAREKMVQRFEALSDLFTLFYHREQIVWGNEVVVIQLCCESKSVVVSPPKGAMEKSFDLSARRASKQLNGLLRNFSAGRHASSLQRFNRAADLHGLCVTHKVVDNQLVNLWTAMETLVPSQVGGSKINKVVKASMPFLLLSYKRRIVNRLLHDLLGWDKWRARKILNKVPLKDASLLDRLTALLAAKECEVIRSELYTKLGDFHLLRYRCFRVSETLSSSEKLEESIGLHEKKVGWQIRRLYRARNIVVHTSRSPSYLATLVANGHEYLDQLTFDVIRICSGDYKVGTIEQAFELVSVFYRSYCSDIAGKAEFNVHESLRITRLPLGLVTDVDAEKIY